jgi:hypothetical protein
MGVTMKLVYVCSPYRGIKGKHIGSDDKIKLHEEIAKAICFTVAENDLVPIAPHLYFTKFLDDSFEDERNMGINCGLALLEKCDVMMIYTGCCGISVGMRMEIEYTKSNNIPYVFIERNNLQSAINNIKAD